MMADMEEMIKEEISRISGLQERVVFKDIIENLFLSLYETNQEMYRKLESRIMDDLAFDLNRYQITVGIVERAYLDPSHHLLSPIREEDMSVPAYDVLEVRRRIDEEGQSLAGTYFMEYDYLEIQKFLEKGKIGGRIYTDAGDYPAEFRVEKKRSVSAGNQPFV